MISRISHVTLLGIAVLLVSTSASAQTVLTIEATFEGGMTEAVQERFRDSLQQGLTEGTGVTALTESQTADALGAEAGRLADCTLETCLSESAALTGAGSAVHLNVMEAGEIYSFELTVYQLEPPETLAELESDCALCTVDEALETVRRLGADGSTSAGSDVTPAADEVTFVIRTDPEDADIYLDGERVGSGVAEVTTTEGEHALRVSAPGYISISDQLVISTSDQDAQIVVTLEAGDDPEPDPITTLEPDPPPDPDPTPDPGVDPDPDPEPTGPRAGGALAGVDTIALGSVLVGTGLASLVTGVVLIAIDGETTCSEGNVEDCEDVFNTAGGGATLTALGSAALASGVIFLLWDTLAGEPAPADEAGLEFGVGWSNGPAFILGSDW